MNEPTVLLKNQSLEQTNGAHANGNGYATPPIVGYGEDASPEGEAHLRDYWRIIRKRLWLIIGIAAIIGAISMIREARLPDYYQAKARVQVDVESYSPALGASRGNTVLVDNNFMDPDYFNTQVQFLSSPTLLRRVAKTLDLEHNLYFLNATTENRSTWQNLQRMFGFAGKQTRTTAKGSIDSGAGEQLALTKSATSADVDEVNRLAPYVGMLQGMIEVDQVKKTRLIDIRCTHSDPQVGAKVCNATADAFGLRNLEVKTKTNTIAGTYLQKRIAELQAQIRSGEEQLVNYARSHEILSLDANQNTVVERLAGLNKQLLEAENDRKMAEAEYNAAKAPGAAGALAEVGAKEIETTDSELAKLRQKRAQLLIEATEEAPEVKEIDQQIDVLQKHLADTRARGTATLLKNLETKYRQAADREEALRKSFNQQKGETVTQNEAAINYRILQQEIETNKGLLDNLLQRSKENDVVLAGRPNNISVVDYAIVPDFPVGPARLRTVMLAFLLAFALGAALALFLEYLDDTVHSTDDVERFLRLPALAVIPAMSSASAPRRLLSSAKSLQKRNGGNGANPELLLNINGRSALAEAYRQLRTSVLLSTAGRAPKTLLVTSSLPGEGKTTTAVNTAISLAQTGANVLIIDADMRRPRLRSIFDLSGKEGLSSILSSEMKPEQMLGTIVKDPTTGLNVLTSGPVPPNPAELLGSEQMRKLIAVLSIPFTHIVIDSP